MIGTPCLIARGRRRAAGRAGRVERQRAVEPGARRGRVRRAATTRRWSRCTPVCWSGCLVEALVADRPFLPCARLADAGRCARRAGAALVVHRDTRVAAGTPGDRGARRCRGDRGPYRLLRHPNYVAVVAEGIALPLVHTAWVTALRFHRAQRRGCCRARIMSENAALAGRRRRGGERVLRQTSTSWSPVAVRSGWPRR